ncbi:MAG: prolyl oligopeptidase family serine peptidase [Caulobacterales bacterium]
MIDRRRLLASAAALGAGAALPHPAAAQALKAPVPRLQPVTETLHGVTLTDPYRWMENPADPDWTPYLMAQNAYARQVLGAIPGRAALEAKIAAASGATAFVTAIQAAGPYVFAQVRPAGANTYKLVVREGLHGAPRTLFDPDTQATAETHYSLDYWVASPDGRYVAYGSSPAGSENSVLHVLETATGKLLPDTLDRAQFGAPSWLPDGSGLLQNRLKEGTKHGDPDHYADSIVWLHRLGSDPSADVKLMGKGLDATVAAQDIDAPSVFVQAGSDAAIGVMISGVENEVALYTAPLAGVAAGKPAWTRVCTPADAVTGAALRGADLYLLTHKDAPRFKLLKTTTTAPSLAAATEVMAQSELVLKGLASARDAIYVQALDAGLGRLIRLAPDGTRSRLKLPFEGSVAALSADPLQDGCWFVLDSWVKPPVVCFGAPDGTVTITDLAPPTPIDVSNYESREVMVTARDGTRVPLSIIYARNLKRDGSAPLYLQAYGAYGLDIDPGFDPRLPTWLDLGGVMAVAHVRGGGELGEGWHRAGMKQTKPNTWHDCIDCARYLIAHHWTSPGKLAVEGTSAGGIMIGRFLTEEPSLLAVAIVRVGDSNATRMENMEAGPANVPEFGTIQDPEGFKGLLEMDAYQHVRNATRYPAVLLTTGVTDPRVAPWEPGKFAARLQAATASGKPVILRVETDAGHGLGSTRTQRDNEVADTYAFILRQVGDGRFA